ncbi:MAG: biotin transporter BioY [Clostridia bacterium]|nr:biotin transporter BioY [Clostridia bacterium]
MKSNVMPTSSQAKPSPASLRRRVTLRLCYAAMGVALLAVCSWISVPFFAVPFTMQTFAVCFVVGLMGTKWGFVTILAYIGLGALGVPVFSGFGGGVGTLIGVTGGYIVGFLATALVAGPLYRLAKDNLVWGFLAMLAGIVACYILGTLWSMFVAGNFTWQGLGSALLACVAPFVAFDMGKIVLAQLLLKRLKPLVARSLAEPAK